jgi:hypothetical protein
MAWAVATELAATMARAVATELAATTAWVIAIADLVATAATPEAWVAEQAAVIALVIATCLVRHRATAAAPSAAEAVALRAPAVRGDHPASAVAVDVPAVDVPVADGAGNSAWNHGTCFERTQGDETDPVDLCIYLLRSRSIGRIGSVQG